MSKPPIAVTADNVPTRVKPTHYPPLFAPLLAGREKRTLGDLFGLSNFGVNLTQLAPGGMSSLRHCHTKQDEFVYILTGHPTLITDDGETPLSPGMCAGFKAGDGNGHHLVNRSGEIVTFIEVGDRTPADSAFYPDDDIQARVDADGKWQFTRKDGTAF